MITKTWRANLSVNEPDWSLSLRPKYRIGLALYYSLDRDTLGVDEQYSVSAVDGAESYMTSLSPLMDLDNDWPLHMRGGALTVPEIIGGTSVFAGTALTYSW